MPKEQPKEVEKNIYDILHRIIGIVGTIVLIPVILIVILAFGYLFIIFGVIDGIPLSAASTVQSIMMEDWRALLPIANEANTILYPILVLLILAGIVRWIAPPEKLNLANITENLPAFLAVFIVATICLLPLLGMEIPNVLSNIALVVVGYYFGKLKIGTSRT